MSAFPMILVKSFKQMGSYAINALSFFLGGLILLIVQTSIWRALFAQGVSQQVGYLETITYVVISNAVFRIFDLKVGNKIGQAVYDGSILQDMLRPVRLQVLYIARELGQAIFHFLTYSIPLIAIAEIFGGLLPPASIRSFCLFLISGALGSIIFGLLNCIIGYSSF